jgi:phospholipid transport system substrate-binding protein
MFQEIPKAPSMTNRRQTLALLATVAVLTAMPGLAFAQTDPAAVVVQDFHDALLALMKKGGAAKARYEMLKPAIEKSFDLAGMTAVAVGPSWGTIPAADQKALIAAFERMTVAQYVGNFNSFGGESFVVEPAAVPRGAEKLVRSRLVTGTEKIPFNYRMRQVGGDWKVFDIFLNGNISQMAQKRSDFAATLSSGGAKGLTQRINALADQQLN